MPTPISIVSIVKMFGSGKNATTAVDDIDLEIDPGELFFLLGPSGCGKTTLLRMIAGFEQPTAGSIRFGDRDVTHVAANQRNTGMVFQSYALWPHMTVEANVAFGLGVRRVSGKERRKRVAEALEVVQMTSYAKRKPNQLSGGQQQRVALARAIVIRPDVLLLDEPLSNLDAKLRNELRVEIRRICKEAGITTVYVTHDQKEALSMADRIGVLDEGRLIQSGTPLELYRRPTSRFVAGFLGETNFVEGAIESVNATHVTVSTPLGIIHTPAQGNVEEGDQVCLSIRPEALTMDEVSTPNTISSKLASMVYLGETAHLETEPINGIRLSASQLNPRQLSERSEITLRVRPEDVVVISMATPTSAKLAAPRAGR